MIKRAGKRMFVRGGGISYLVDNIDYNYIKNNYKDKFRIGLSLCGFYFYHKYVVRIKNI